MKCPKCHDKTEVLQTITQGAATNRRRRCLSPRCGHRFTTAEHASEPHAAIPSTEDILVTLSKKKRKPGSTFDPEAIAAAITVDRRKALIRREQKRQRRQEWEDSGFDPAPSRLDYDGLRKEIDGY